MTGLTREQVIGKRVLEILPETESLWIERYGRVALTGEPAHFEAYARSFGRHFEVLAYQIREGQFAVTFADITERKKAEEQLQYTALHDSLTTLPNRRLFEDRLDQAIKTARRSGGRAALFYLDLDGFKSVNDLYGHEAGDTVLRDVAVRIRGCIRTSDTAARVGGDEFVVVLPDVAGREGARLVSQKIVDAIDQPFMVSNQECRVGASIGISLFPDDGSDLEILMKAADRAMYEVKKKRKEA
jgi:diguanylate cyclase (GGDEF)-like protein